MNDQPASKPAQEQPTSWTSEQLLGGSTDVVIYHKGEAYHLKKTKNDKLILMK